MLVLGAQCIYPRFDHCDAVIMFRCARDSTGAATHGEHGRRVLERSRAICSSRRPIGGCCGGVPYVRSRLVRAAVQQRAREGSPRPDPANQCAHSSLHFSSSERRTTDRHSPGARCFIVLFYVVYSY